MGLCETLKPIYILFARNSFWNEIFFNYFMISMFEKKQKQKQKLKLTSTSKGLPNSTLTQCYILLNAATLQWLKPVMYILITFNIALLYLSFTILKKKKKKLVEANLKFESFAIGWYVKNNIENEGFKYLYRMSRIDYKKLSHALK